ncbi:hypothetical protein [Burkholderia plantarii]|uniref:hypothetical protein n=1 Tax=Burkholderia plantarii TaxID=41899 RepID=UPI000F4DBF53|nr:hypothetical protein [Burkholderia plantarii]
MQLPSVGALRLRAANKATVPVASFDFESYTLWHEPEADGWSLTNPYEVDNFDFLSSEHDFSQLIDAVRCGRSPVRPGSDSEDGSDDLSDMEYPYRAHDIAGTIVRRAGNVIPVSTLRIDPH